MAFMEDVRNRTYIAGSDLSAKQFCFVTMAADGEVDATGDGARATGVLLVPGAAGEAVTVCYDGRVTVKAGGAVSKGDAIASDAAGEAVEAATAGDIILGYALEDAADGQIFTIELSRAGEAVPA